MRYLALACDFDGTLARGGVIAPETLEALERVRASGRRCILVTGRALDDILEILPRPDVFDRIVAENGAVLHRPIGHETRLLGAPPPPRFVDRLRAKDVDPVSVGRVIVATLRPHEHTVLDAIRDLQLELRIVFNRDAVMILPAGINKGGGLRVALLELGMSPHEAVGVGDAENDQSLLALCECSVAVANAVPSLIERADIVTRSENGAGVVELVDALVTEDLRRADPRLERRHVLVGTSSEGEAVRIPPYGRNILVAGPSGSGKTTVTMALLERLTEQAYQYCVVDPEGDYSVFEDVIELGDPHRPPSIDEILHVLRSPGANVSANLLGVLLAERPAFVEQLFPRLQSMRARTGRPHWIVIDEAHHLWPAAWGPLSVTLPSEVGELVLVTVDPAEIARVILERIDILIAVGTIPDRVIHSFCEAVGERAPSTPSTARARNVVFWSRTEGAAPVCVQPVKSRAEHLRHRRKYAEGNLGDSSFYFRGPDDRLRLRARNLALFIEMADGVDDATWIHHLTRHDYSRWFRDKIKDPALSSAAALVEDAVGMSAGESRALIRDAILARYTLPARFG